MLLIDRHQPWELHVPDVGYPMPIVNEKIARTQATRQLYAIRKGEDYRKVSDAIVKKHASRRSHFKKKRKRCDVNDKQQELPL